MNYITLPRRRFDHRQRPRPLWSHRRALYRSTAGSALRWATASLGASAVSTAAKAGRPRPRLHRQQGTDPRRPRRANSTAPADLQLQASDDNAIFLHRHPADQGRQGKINGLPGFWSALMAPPPARLRLLSLRSATGIVNFDNTKGTGCPPRSGLGPHRLRVRAGLEAH